MKYKLPPKEDCPECKSKDTDIDYIEADRWRHGGHNEGHYTEVVGYECTCFTCGHKWDYEDDPFYYEEKDVYDDD